MWEDRELAISFRLLSIIYQENRFLCLAEAKKFAALARHQVAYANSFGVILLRKVKPEVTLSVAVVVRLLGASSAIFTQRTG